MKYSRVAFSRLSEAEKEALVREAAPSWIKIFGTSEEDLRGYWMEKKSKRTVIYLLRDDDDTIVGSFTVKFYDVDYQGQKLTVVKLGVGVLPEVRGGKFTLRCVMNEFLVAKLWFYPFENMYFFSTLIHPVTYQICATVLDEMFPHYARPSSKFLQELAGFLANKFGLTPSDRGIPFIYKEVRSAVERPQTKQHWLTKKHPAVRYFVTHCPNYDSDECFIIVAPVRMSIFVSVANVFAKHTVAKLANNYLPQRKKPSAGKWSRARGA